MVAGWQEVAGIGATQANLDDERADAGVDLLPPLATGQPLEGTFAAERKKTQPPRRHTEASLLAAMESAGRALTDDEMRQAMKDTGLGTPATRASIIETLLKRDYVRRDKKTLLPTAMGMALINTLPVVSLASPELTGEWEARLARIARGQETREPFMADIAEYVRQTIAAIAGAPMPAVAASEPVVAKKIKKQKTQIKQKEKSTKTNPKKSVRLPSTVEELVCPRCQEGHLLTGKRGWGCSRWRQGCGFVVWFETAGSVLTEAQLIELVTKHKTRRGKLLLDPAADGGVRLPTK